MDLISGSNLDAKMVAKLVSKRESRRAVKMVSLMVWTKVAEWAVTQAALLERYLGKNMACEMVYKTDMM